MPSPKDPTHSQQVEESKKRAASPLIPKGKKPRNASGSRPGTPTEDSKGIDFVQLRGHTEEYLILMKHELNAVRIVIGEVLDSCTKLKEVTRGNKGKTRSNKFWGTEDEFADIIEYMITRESTLKQTKEQAEKEYNICNDHLKFVQSDELKQALGKKSGHTENDRQRMQELEETHNKVLKGMRKILDDDYLRSMGLRTGEARISDAG